MYLPVIFICVFILLTVLLFLIRLNILIEYLRNGNDDHFVISIFALWGILKIKYEIPLIDIKKEGLKIKRYKEIGKAEEVKEKEKRHFSFTELYDKFEVLKDFYEANKSLVFTINNYLKCRLELSELKINVAAGTGNACLTGILCGLIWSVIGTGVSFLANKFKTLKKSATVKPDFSDAVLKIDLYCIFNVKIVHIIVVGVKVLIHYFNKKLKIKKAIGGGIVG